MESYQLQTKLFVVIGPLASTSFSAKARSEPSLPALGRVNQTRYTRNTVAHITCIDQKQESNPSREPSTIHGVLVCYFIRQKHLACVYQRHICWTLKPHH